MEQTEKLLLVIKTSRITSLKSLFFPMEYHFYDADGDLLIIKVTRNWIGQKKQTKEPTGFFKAKGIFLKRLVFASGFGTSYHYGQFWSSDVKQAKQLVEKYIPVSRRLGWSNTWF